MRTTLLCALLSASLAVPVPQVPSQAAPQPGRTVRQWTTIHDGDAGFSAEFPAPPIRNTMPNGMVRWMVQLDNDHYAYIVGSISIPAERMALGVPKLLDDAVAGGLNNVAGARKLTETGIRVGPHPGREMTLIAPGATGELRLTARAIIAGNQLFVVTAVSPAEGYDQKEVDRFLLSLGVMPR